MAGGSDSQRMMLKVCYQAYRRHLSHKQIAANLGITPLNVRVRITRIKSKLKEIIKNMNYEY